ncbi:MAG: phosphatase PAP2 family protein [Paludibacteraceae bacterium]|nr:phosphatase PAP2 family protein [Prevotellaceae bacterium]
MMENILEWDRQMMVALNLSGSHTVFGDYFMWMTTQIFIWVPVVLMLLYVVCKNKGREAIPVILMIIAVFVLCDQVSSSIMKPLVARPRPGHDPLVMDLLQYVHDYRGGAFGFPSSHAANSFGFAMFSALLFRYRWYSLVVFVWATLCAYTRLYLGVHFPLDILTGISLGLLFGGLCYFIYCHFWNNKKYQLSKHAIASTRTASGFEKSDLNRLLGVLLIVFFCIVFFAYKMTTV